MIYTKEKAQQRVKYALQRGRLVRPSQCQRCGRSDDQDRYGQPMIIAHHSDYSKPLDIEWICVWCHVSGEMNGNSKLTRDDVRAILQSKESANSLVNKYGVGETTIRSIRDGEKWSAITGIPKAPKNPKYANRGRRTCIEYNGERRTISEWARIVGIHRDSLRGRLEAGWPLPLALSKEKTNGNFGVHLKASLAEGKCRQ